jgi:hypothetical protein
MIFNWLQIVWVWLRHNVTYFFPRIRGRESDSDSSEDERVCRVPCKSAPGMFDEVDHLPIARRDRANFREPVRNGELTFLIIDEWVWPSQNY